MSKIRKTESTTTKKETGAELHRTSRTRASRICRICGAEVAPISEESLCWVCRRLKVSAWNEGVDSQMFAAE